MYISELGTILLMQYLLEVIIKNLKLLFIPFAILFFYWAIRSEDKRQNEIDRVGLENLNLQLTGVIDSVIEGRNYHGFGIIRVKILASNIKEYDPRPRQSFYFCIIKNGMAEFYDHTPINSHKGDTIIYDTKAKLGAYLKNGMKEDEGSITINANEDYYDFIRRKTMFK